MDPEKYLDELLAAARREVRYRVATGDLRPEDLTPEELVGETLVRARREQGRRPAGLSERAWLLALLHRVSENIVQKEARARRLAAVSLEAEPPPEPVVYDDDEEFYEWYQPDEMTKWEDLVAEPSQLTPEELTAAEEELRSAAPRTRLVYVLHDIHRLTVPEIAQALGIPGAEVLRLLREARRQAGKKGRRH